QERDHTPPRHPRLHPEGQLHPEDIRDPALGAAQAVRWRRSSVGRAVVVCSMWICSMDLKLIVSTTTRAICIHTGYLHRENALFFISTSIVCLVMCAVNSLVM